MRGDAAGGTHVHGDRGVQLVISSRLSEAADSLMLLEPTMSPGNTPEEKYLEQRSETDGTYQRMCCPRCLSVHLRARWVRKVREKRSNGSGNGEGDVSDGLRLRTARSHRRKVYWGEQCEKGR